MSTIHAPHSIPSTHEFVTALLPEHPEAVAFLRSLFLAMHVWDDLIDRDKPVQETDINAAFGTLLIDVPANPFYLRHIAQLHPLLSVVVIDWLAANDLEATDSQLDKEIAFITRSGYAVLIVKVLEICRGYAFARTAMADVRRVIHQEGFAAYLAALEVQKKGA